MDEPKITSVAGVARALLRTVGVERTVVTLISQFGWDRAFCALALVEEPSGRKALWRTLQLLGNQGRG